MASNQENNNDLNSFFEVEYGSLKRYIQSKIKQTSESDAEDIIQEVALRIFSRPLDALPINNIGGFVYGAIRNKITDILRSKKRRVDHQEEIEQLWTDFTNKFYDGSSSTYPEQIREKLKIAITNLKPMYRDIIIAVDFEGYTYREISRETGISPGTLMSRRHRALSILLKDMEIQELKKLTYEN
ncbi:RNA polymerase sigma-70 factor, ECF subfamily [Maribacter sedimenticola]|uniref:RNA polymerase sigma-70 factor, ECF subfamily n=1 Tax=Maribacter sedimenticola TaxID=228956 RepID=A0ABY1SCH7_9FLAO|nr:RNA polymerase sigma factor [Maribacter sedimenticola]SNR26238.1 RNA polymerase sigma-70 factor, ECF subfamily [Maribacter sedimenticola]